MTFFKFLTTKAFLKQLIFAALLLVILCFLVLWWLRSTTNHGQQLEVPSLAKLSLDRVEDVLEERDLTYEILDSANYNPDFPKYSVIEQIPKAGKFVKEDRKIYLYLNPSGYRRIKIPNILSKTERQAVPTLLASGFEIGKISKRPHISDQVLEIRHKGERIEVGDELQKTSKIDLIVGDGSKNRVQNEPDDNEAQPDNNSEEIATDGGNQ